MIRSFARDFLEKECPKSMVRAMEMDDAGYSPELWAEMANLGMMGLALPEDHGGAGSSFLDLCIMIEEQGRFLLPSPFFSTVALCGFAIARFGTDGQKAAYLPQIAAGERILAYAQTGAEGRVDGVRHRTRSRRGRRRLRPQRREDVRPLRPYSP